MSIRNLLVLLHIVTSVSMAHASCWSEASARYNVEVTLLKSLAWQESRGNPKAVGPKLKSGDRALGLMQINTVHLPLLRQYGIEQDHLFDACTSVMLGAWVMSDCIAKKGAVWAAVACYYAGPNARPTRDQLNYVQSVQRHYAGYKTQESQEINQ